MIFPSNLYGSNAVALGHGLQNNTNLPKPGCSSCMHGVCFFGCTPKHVHPTGSTPSIADLQVLGLHSLRFFSSLMPLLLGWCHEADQATCLAALQVLQEVIKHTWPRMPAHASFLWSQLQQISTEQAAMCAQDEHSRDAPVSTTMAEIMQCGANIGEMLYLCGGSALQKAIQDTLGQSRDFATDMMLQSIAVRKSAQQTEGVQVV